jgi:hypothetical protein
MDDSMKLSLGAGALGDVGAVDRDKPKHHHPRHHPGGSPKRHPGNAAPAKAPVAAGGGKARAGRRFVMKGSRPAAARRDTRGVDMDAGDASTVEDTLFKDLDGTAWVGHFAADGSFTTLEPGGSVSWAASATPGHAYKMGVNPPFPNLGDLGEYEPEDEAPGGGGGAPAPTTPGLGGINGTTLGGLGNGPGNGSTPPSGPLTSSQVSALSTTQVTALSTTQVAGLSTDALAAMTPGQLGALTTSQVAALTSTQLASLRSDQIGALSPTQIAALTQGQIGALTPVQVKALTSSQIGAMRSDQVGALTSSQLGAMSSSQLGAILGQLRADQIAALRADQFGGFTPSQIGGLTSEQLGAFTSAQKAALTPAQQTGLSPAQITLLGLAIAKPAPSGPLGISGSLSPALAAPAPATTVAAAAPAAPGALPVPAASTPLGLGGAPGAPGAQAAPAAPAATAGDTGLPMPDLGPSGTAGQPGATNTKVKVFSEPNLEAPVLGILARGASVRFVKSYGGMTCVAFDGGCGWIPSLMIRWGWVGPGVDAGELPGDKAAQRRQLDQALNAAIARAQAKDPETSFLNRDVIAAQKALNDFDRSNPDTGDTGWVVLERPYWRADWRPEWHDRWRNRFGERYWEHPEWLRWRNRWTEVVDTGELPGDKAAQRRQLDQALNAAIASAMAKDPATNIPSAKFWSGEGSFDNDGYRHAIREAALLNPQVIAARKALEAFDRQNTDAGFAGNVEDTDAGWMVLPFWHNRWRGRYGERYWDHPEWRRRWHAMADVIDTGGDTAYGGIGGSGSRWSAPRYFRRGPLMRDRARGWSRDWSFRRPRTEWIEYVEGGGSPLLAGVSTRGGGAEIWDGIQWVPNVEVEEVEVDSGDTGWMVLPHWHERWRARYGDRYWDHPAWRRRWYETAGVDVATADTGYGGIGGGGGGGRERFFRHDGRGRGERFGGERFGGFGGERERFGERIGRERFGGERERRGERLGREREGGREGIATVNANVPVFPNASAPPGTDANHSPGVLHAGARVTVLEHARTSDGKRLARIRIEDGSIHRGAKVGDLLADVLVPGFALGKAIGKGIRGDSANGQTWWIDAASVRGGGGGGGGGRGRGERGRGERGGIDTGDDETPAPSKPSRGIFQPILEYVFLQIINNLIDQINPPGPTIASFQAAYNDMKGVKVLPEDGVLGVATMEALKSYEAMRKKKASAPGDTGDIGLPTPEEVSVLGLGWLRRLPNAGDLNLENAELWENEALGFYRAGVAAATAALSRAPTAVEAAKIAQSAWQNVGHVYRLSPRILGPLVRVAWQRVANAVALSGAGAGAGAGAGVGAAALPVAAAVLVAVVAVELGYLGYKLNDVWKATQSLDKPQANMAVAKMATLWAALDKMSAADPKIARTLKPQHDACMAFFQKWKAGYGFLGEPFALQALNAALADTQVALANAGFDAKTIERLKQSSGSDTGFAGNKVDTGSLSPDLAAQRRALDKAVTDAIAAANAIDSSTSFLNPKVIAAQKALAAFDRDHPDEYVPQVMLTGRAP